MTTIEANPSSMKENLQNFMSLWFLSPIDRNIINVEMVFFFRKFFWPTAFEKKLSWRSRKTFETYWLKAENMQNF
jgi:hypothetical protein